MIDKAELFGNYAVDFEYVLVSIKNLDTAQIRQSNTLVDNIFLADKKRTRKEWTEEHVGAATADQGNGNRRSK